MSDVTISSCRIINCSSNVFPNRKWKLFCFSVNIRFNLLLYFCFNLMPLEVWIGLGGTQSAVYATEVSAEEYLAYTTEETEKVEVYRLAEQLGGDIEAVIRQLAERRRKKE